LPIRVLFYVYFPRVEGVRRAASFELPSPSLSSKKAPGSRLLDLSVGSRLLRRLFKRHRRLYGPLSTLHDLSLSTALGCAPL
jgi:hypothetical protein